MVKKKSIKTKSSSFKIPESFSALSFKNKIISVVLLVLVIGIIGSLLPGNVTGGAVTNTFQNVFAPLKGLLSGVNDLITTIFGVFFPSEKDPLIIYARVLLFGLVIGLIYFGMKLFGSESPFVNLLVGVAIAYLSTFFIPMDVILASGLLYSTTFMSLLLLVPFIILWMVYFKLPKTRGGYVLKSILAIIILSLTTGTSVQYIQHPLTVTLVSIATVVALGALAWAVVKIFTVKKGEQAEVNAVNRVTSALRTRIDELLAKGGKKAT